jgi:hypothetical protein
MKDYVRAETHEKVKRQRDWYKHLLDTLLDGLDVPCIKDVVEWRENPPSHWGGGSL